MIHFIYKKHAIAAFIVCLFSLFLFVAPPAYQAVSGGAEEEKDFIKWVDFSPGYDALSLCLNYDIKSHTEEGANHVSWIDMLAYLGAKYGGNFSYFKKSDVNKLIEEMKKSGKTIDELGQSFKTYAYFKEAYGAVLGGFVGEHNIEVPDGAGGKKMLTRYGLKVFSPIARGYSFSHFDDFGASRSYGYRRRHLGHDLMGSVGTPVIAVESGTVENVGWNQYGGWRIGIRSFDKKRYYYYAHLRKDHPYNDMYEGKIVTAGDVIGYLGMTGYSKKENVNNINTPHLHWGLQLIFDEKTQKEGANEIWVSLYAITKLLGQNQSQVYKVNGEYERMYQMFEESAED